MAPLISAIRAAQQLGVSTKTLDNWRSSGKSELNFVKVGWLIKYKQEDIDNYINTNTFKHTGESKHKEKTRESKTH
jgi:predicted site-specific integrase-resolvase